MAINIKKYAGILAGSKYIFLLNLTDKLFSFGIMLLLARNFSTEIYGIIVTLITLSMVFVSIFDLGLPIYIQREIAVNRSNSGEIFSRVFITSTLLIVLYYFFLLILVHFIYPDIPFTLFTIITVMMYISFLVTISGKALSAINEYKKQFIAFILPRVLILAFFITGIYSFRWNGNNLMLVMLLGIIINLLLALRYLLRNNIYLSLKGFSLIGVTNMIAISIPLGLAVIFNFLYDKIDILLISKQLDYNEAAFYNIAYGLFKASSLGFSFLLVAGFTKVAELNRNADKIKEFFTEHAKIITVICILFNVILYFFADFIIYTIYTDKFTDSIAILRILSFGIIAMGLNNLTGIILNGMGYFKIVMYITLYALLMNVVFNVMFIPLYGIKASAYLTLITEYFILIVEWIYMRKIFAELKQKSV
ncbi:MAG: polysaccharide biosynthesis C-terminal domain-containing protein [Ignavibacteria bacterium]